MSKALGPSQRPSFASPSRPPSPGPRRPRPRQLVATFDQRLEGDPGGPPDPEEAAGRARHPRRRARPARQPPANLAHRADTLWRAAAALHQAFVQAHQEILQFNESARRLEFEVAVIGSHLDLLNNLGTYPVRAEFEGEVKRLKEEWDRSYGIPLGAFGADFESIRADVISRVRQSYSIDLEAEGYRRGGQANPYAPGKFAKFFATDGMLAPDEWEKDAQNWRKYRKTTEVLLKRQQDRRAALQATADRLNALRERVVERAGRWAGKSRNSGFGSRSAQEDRLTIGRQRRGSSARVSRPRRVRDRRSPIRLRGCERIDSRQRIPNCEWILSLTYQWLMNLQFGIRDLQSDFFTSSRVRETFGPLGGKVGRPCHNLSSRQQLREAIFRPIPRRIASPWGVISRCLVPARGPK